MLNRLVGMDALRNHAGGGKNFWKNKSKQTFIRFDAQGQPDKTSMGRRWQTMYAYDASGNLQKLYRNGPNKNGSDGYAMDRLEYFYPARNNRLDYVTDQQSLSPHYAADIDTGQKAGNYAYDASGNLLSDAQEGTSAVFWDRFNKVTTVLQDDGPDLRFAYDAAGQRARKTAGATTEHYVRDGSGNLLALYKDTRLGDTAAVGPTAADTLNARKAFALAVLAEMTNQLGCYQAGLSFNLIFSDCRSGPSNLEFTNCIGTDADRWAGISMFFDLDCLGAKMLELGEHLPVDSSYAGLIKGTHYDQRELAEVPLYGAARLGVDKERRFLLDSLNYRRSVWNPLAEAWQTLALLDPTGAAVSDWPEVDTLRMHVLGHRRYEFSNHLGNVLAVTSDRKILVDSAHTFLYYEADIYALTDYYPFGMQMTGRTASLYVDTATGEKSVRMDYNLALTCSTCVKVDKYRYGFNGMEGDPEWKGEGNSYTTEFRMLDVRIGRWLSIDPLAADYAGWSPYAAFNCNPVFFKDPSGLEGECPDCNDGAYKVKEGDTFWGLEEQWGMEHGALAEYNPGIDPQKLAVGQKINTEPDVPVNKPFATLRQETTYQTEYKQVEEHSALELMAPVAITTSVADGPAPFGEAVGAALLTGALLYDAISPPATISIPIEVPRTVTRRQPSNFYYATYTKTHPDGRVYVGRTSGYGNPQLIVTIRDRKHHKSKEGFGPAVVSSALPATRPGGYSSRGSDISYYAIRGSEQIQIEYWRSQGLSGNPINGISPTNEKRYRYFDAARDAFFKPK